MGSASLKEGTQDIPVLMKEKSSLLEKKIIGRVTAVRGSVVDVCFPATLPPINALLEAGEEGNHH